MMVISLGFLFVSYPRLGSEEGSNPEISMVHSNKGLFSLPKEPSKGQPARQVTCREKPLHSSQTTQKLSSTHSRGSPGPLLHQSMMRSPLFPTS